MPQSLQATTYLDTSRSPLSSALLSVSFGPLQRPLYLYRHHVSISGDASRSFLIRQCTVTNSIQQCYYRRSDKLLTLSIVFKVHEPYQAHTVGLRTYHARLFQSQVIIPAAIHLSLHRGRSPTSISS